MNWLSDKQSSYQITEFVEISEVGGLYSDISDGYCIVWYISHSPSFILKIMSVLELLILTQCHSTETTPVINYVLCLEIKE
jgi:hypothetical protein